MKISIIGAGYVGLVSAAFLAGKNDIICYDKNKEKIDMLNNGIIPIYEKGLEELIKTNKDRLTYTCEKQLAYKDVDIIFICVGTPEGKEGLADLKYIYEVADDIILNINKDCIIVIKSTVPVGTNYEIENYINEKIKEKYRIEIASNPEFLSQGTAVNDTLNAERIVIGTHSTEVRDILKKIYSDLTDANILCTDINSAEMIKYASNSFLALKISYINEIANLCEKLESNIDDVSKGMGLDSRIGNKFLNAGIGYGGSCLPKDTKALYSFSKIAGCEMTTIRDTIQINENQSLKLIEKLKKYYHSFENLNIAILGVAFKPETDDLRNSPAVKNIEILKSKGANIKIWDLLATDNLKESIKNMVIYCDTIDETIKDTDACLIFTDWKQIKEYDIKRYKQLMNTPIVLDGRNCYNLSEVENTSITYESIGRNTLMKKKKV